MKRLACYAQFVVGFTLLVIMWGAYVRASGSGAGCGSHWPLCNGTALPVDPSTKTMVEFFHRTTSGLALIFVFILGFLTYKKFPRKSAARRAAFWSCIFILAEAAIGAALVLLRLVEGDSSALRAIVIGFHLVNTFALIGALTTTWFVVRYPDITFHKLTAQSKTLLNIAAAGLVIVGASGGIVALGDTLFPSASLIEGMKADLNPTAHFLIRLRLWHPIFAVLESAFLILMARTIAHSASRLTKNSALVLMGMVALQVLVGFTNLSLLAPIWLQLVHLLLAEAVLICLALFWLRVASDPATLREKS